MFLSENRLHFSGTCSRRAKKHGKASERRAGFTLIETLVALSVVLAFAGALGPLMFQSQHILLRGEGQIRAELLLRALLATPIDRNNPQLGAREGEDAGLRWRVDVEPWEVDLGFDDPPQIDATKEKRPNWSLLKLTAHVFLGEGKMISAETLKLGAID